VDEIDTGFGCAAKTVEYKLRNIGATWLRLLSEGPTAELPS
jgi:hypothetical protein